MDLGIYPEEMLTVQIVDSEYLKCIDRIINMLDSRYPGGCFFGSLINEIQVFRNKESCFQPNILIPGEHSIHWIVPHQNNLPQNDDSIEDIFEYQKILHETMEHLFLSSENVYFKWFMKTEMRYNIYYYQLYWEIPVHSGNMEDGEIHVWDIFLYSSVNQNNFIQKTLSDFMWGNAKFLLMGTFYEWDYDKSEIKNISRDLYLKYNFRDGCTDTLQDSDIKKQKRIYNLNPNGINVLQNYSVPHYYTHFPIDVYTREQHMYIQKMFFVYNMLCENVMGFNTLLFNRNEIICNDRYRYKKHECNICTQQQEIQKSIKTRCCCQEVCTDCILKIFNEHFSNNQTFACCPFCRNEWSIKEFILEIK